MNKNGYDYYVKRTGGFQAPLTEHQETALRLHNGQLTHTALARFKAPPYGPCPCNSGLKFRFCCMKKV